MTATSAPGTASDQHLVGAAALPPSGRTSRAPRAHPPWYGPRDRGPRGLPLGDPRLGGVALSYMPAHGAHEQVRRGQYGRDDPHEGHNHDHSGHEQRDHRERRREREDEHRRYETQSRDPFEPIHLHHLRVAVAKLWRRYERFPARPIASRCQPIAKVVAATHTYAAAVSSGGGSRPTTPTTAHRRVCGRKEKHWGNGPPHA